MLANVPSLLWVIGGLAVAFSVVLPVLRPKWAHLDYDKALWIQAFSDTKSWLHEYRKTESGVILGAFLIPLLTSPGDFQDRLLAAVVNGFGAVVIGFVTVFLWEFAQAPWRLQDKAKTARVDARVEFRVELEETTREEHTVFLHVRNNLPSGLFSAQVWLTGGGSYQHDTFSLPWKNSNQVKREIGKGEEQVLRVARVARTQTNEFVGCDIFLFEAESEDRKLEPRHSFRLGDDGVAWTPVQIYLHITDPTDTHRPLIVRVHPIVSGLYLKTFVGMDREY